MRATGPSRRRLALGEETSRGFRPAFVLSLVAHAALAVWVVVELGLPGSGGPPRPHQARIESELNLPDPTESAAREELPGEAPTEPTEEPEAPEPRIEDDLVLPAPWRRPTEDVDRPRGVPREDLKRSSVVVSRSRPLPPPDRAAKATAEPKTEPECPEATPPAEGAPTAPRRIGARKVPADCPSPDYPERARLRNLEGRVVMIADIGPDGAVLDVRLQTSSGHDLLDRAALEAVRRWRFSPAREDGRAVRDRVLIPIGFHLPRR
jgi:protein TonB